MAMATASGMEWLTSTNSRPKPPTSIFWPAFTSRRSTFLMPNSSSLLRTSPRVSLVAVSEDYCADLVRVLPEVGEVRQDEVYPRHLLVGEGQAAVHQDHAALL